MRYSLHSVQTQESEKNEAISRKQYSFSYLGTMCSHSFSLMKNHIKNVLLTHITIIITPFYLSVNIGGTKQSQTNKVKAKPA